MTEALLFVIICMSWRNLVNIGGLKSGQVGNTLLDFGVKKVKVADPRVLNWVEVDKMH